MINRKLLTCPPQVVPR